MKTTRFSGKTVMITGAGRGIGQATAFRFAREGAKVMLIGRTLAPLEESVAAILADGGLAWAYQADISVSENVRGIVDNAMERTGRIDILINNAGIEDRAEFTEIQEENWDKVIGTNQRAYFLLSQRVAREMKKTGGGSILFNASVCALGGGRLYASYYTSKAALLGLTRAMACELGQYHIRVNCVSPGPTLTDMIKASYGEEMIQYVRNSFKRVPLGRMVEPAEIASTFAFLASDDASAITGTNIVVDCGLLADMFIAESMPDLK